jgi:hypothetical protein
MPPRRKASKTFGHHYVKHNYHDHSQDTPLTNVDYEALRIASPNGQNDFESLSGAEIPCRKTRGKARNFPKKLHELLEHAEAKGLSDVISWKIHGRAFSINNAEEFCEKIMPSYFNQTKITSFFRQLNIYGFIRITHGCDKGAYYHELFLRGKYFLTTRILRQKVKGTRVKGLLSPETEPDFYSMPYVMGSLSIPTVTASASPNVAPYDLMLTKPSSSCLTNFSSLSFHQKSFDEKPSHFRLMKYDTFFNDVTDADTFSSGSSQWKDDMLDDFSAQQETFDVMRHLYQMKCTNFVKDEADVGTFSSASSQCKEYIVDVSSFDCKGTFTMLQKHETSFELQYKTSDIAQKNKCVEVDTLSMDDQVHDLVHYSLQECNLLCALLQDMTE